MPNAANLQNELLHLPLSEELLAYYRQRLESSEAEFQRATERIDQIQATHEEVHRLSWELHKRSQEVVEMQQALSDFQVALFDERKHTLRIVAENDELKIQELKDRKKIRFLLSLSGAPDEEVTYFRDRLDKRLVKIARDSRKKMEDRDLLILEDEVQGLRLNVSSLQTQLDEQRKAYDATISGLMKDRRSLMEQERIRREHDAAKIDELLEKVKKLRVLCRENTRELLRTKKVSMAHERTLIEEKASMIKELGALRAQLSREQDRNESVEKIVEVRVNRKQESVVSDLRQQVSKLEADLRASQIEAASNRRIEYLKSRLESVNASYASLKRRRDYEIEGFTTDIMSLRKQLRTLEKNILKFGPLEDKELVLLNMARLTGERANRISTQLQTLKSKIYATEKQVQELGI
nr:Coiled-coil domain-containing protein 77 [Polyrhizophydium stewartii]